MKLIQASLMVIVAIAITGCKAQPPKETGEFKPTDLVELIKLDSTIHLDIRYATNNNFVGRPLYKEARAFLQRPAARVIG